MPLIITLEKRVIKFIVNNLCCTNPRVNVISEFAISNPMSSTGRNYRNLLDYYGELNANNSILTWTERREELHHTIFTLHELIEIRDGIQECIGFTHSDIDDFISNICIH